MIKTFLLHVVYEQCLTAFFKNILNNFSAPITKIKSIDGKVISAIEILITVDGKPLKIVYSDVTIIVSDDIGMTVECAHGTMHEYPMELNTTVFNNHNFRDYIKYEDIVEIFE